MRLIPLTIVFECSRSAPNFQQLGMLGAGRLGADLLLVVDADRVRRIEVEDAAILDEHGRHAIERRGDEERAVEPDLGRPRRDGAVPVDIAVAEPQVPLADEAGGIARTLQHRGQGVAAGADQRGRVARQDFRSRCAPGVIAGQKGVARRGAGGRGGMRPGEPRAARREPIDVRRPDPGRTVAAEVAIAEVVGIDEDDVRAARGGGGRACESQRKRQHGCRRQQSPACHPRCHASSPRSCPTGIVPAASPAKRDAGSERCQRLI